MPDRIMRRFLLSVGLSLLLALFALLALARTTSARPAAFNVNTTVDEIDDNLSDSTCHTVSNKCSLRAAVQQANQLNGVSIVVPSGTYVLTDVVNGDLTLQSDMTINGAGAATTFV